MKNSLIKMQYVLFALSLMALAACGVNDKSASSNLSNGQITAKLAWPSSSASANKAAAKSVALVANVTRVQLVVTGAGVPTAKADVDKTNGGSVEVYPGTDLIVAAYAYDSSNTLLYEGFVTGVTVTSGAQTQVGTITLVPPSLKAADVTCVQCHENTNDVTGQNLVVAFKQSGHYVNQNWTGAPLAFTGSVAGTGCAGCHGPSHDITNPYAGGTASRCFDCHNLGNTNTTLVANHGTYYLNNGTECSACHQPHDTKAGNMERKSWAQSGHGGTAYPMYGVATTNSCALRCHSPLGFVAAINNPSLLVNGTMTPAKQMITCNACHSDATRGVLRTLAGTSANPYVTYSSSKGYQFAPNQAAFNPNKKAYYPDVAGSNLCIVCHSGTTEGSTTSLGLSDPYFVNSATAAQSTVKKGGLLTQHNMPAAAVMYVKFGFMNLSTGTAGTTQTYLNSLTSDLDAPKGTTGTVTSTHRKLGTTVILGDTHKNKDGIATFATAASLAASGGTSLTTNGPCAACHVTGSHSFRIDQAAIDNVCSRCHASENGIAIASESAFSTYFIEPQQEVYRHAIELGASVINKKVADYNATLTATPNALGYSTSAPLQFYVGINPYTSAQAGKVTIVKFLLSASGVYNATSNPFTTYKDDGTINTASSTTTAANYAAPGTANANYFAAASTTSPYYQADYTNAAIALGYSQVAGDAGYTKFVGALSNLAFFAKDQGGFAHARTYSRRLIYDSIDFLDDGSLNMSVGTTATTLSGQPTITVNGSAYTNPVSGLYTKGTAAYTIVNGALGVPASGTSESMLYLIGWNRTTGAWNTPQRP